MDIYNTKKRLEKEYAQLSRDDLLWILALQNTTQRASMLPASFREKALQSMEDKGLDEIIGSLSTVQSLQRAFNYKGVRVKKSDWIQLVSDAICNKCCAAPERGFPKVTEYKPSDLEKVLKGLSNSMEEDEFRKVVQETLAEAVREYPEAIAVPDYVEPVACPEGSYYDQDHQRCEPVLVSAPPPPPMPKPKPASQPKGVPKPRPVQQPIPRQDDFLTDIRGGIRLKSASERQLADAPPKEDDLVDLFKRVMTGRREVMAHSLEESDSESEDEDWI